MQPRRMQYQVKQFDSVLENLHQRQVSGTLQVTANLASGLKSRQFVLHKGEIVYGGVNIPDNAAFAKWLSKKLDRSMIERAVNFAIPKLTDKKSARELLETIVRIRVIQWKEIETLVLDLVVQAIEQLLPYPGEYHLEENVTFDLTYADSRRGLDWSHLKKEIEQRQQIWQSFIPWIPSMDAIPHLQKDNLASLTDISVRQQLQQQVDGKRSLIAIAEHLDRDPLTLGQSYLMWAQAGWLTCKQKETAKSASTAISTPIPPDETSNRPSILSVDDSPIVQTTIKRILSDRYEVLLANNAIAALNILNTHQVRVLLLDVTMPDIDGLEFCKTLRGIPKFKNLPIVMLTAKDSIIDKFQGFVAGSNQYLYKPVEPEKLLEVVGSYVKS